MLALQAADHTPAWLAFSGAVIVAVVAAVTAQWRQRVEMRHDRHMHDLGELRALLDECAQVVAETSQNLINYSNLLAHTPREGAPLAEQESSGSRRIVLDAGVTVEISPPFTSVEDAEEALLASAGPLFGLYQRVLLRLGQNHSVSLALLAIQAGTASAPLTAAEIDALPFETPERWKRIEAWQEETREDHFTFLAACHYLVRSRVAGDSPL